MTSTLEICNDIGEWVPIGGDSVTSPTPEPWVRPSDWLPLPEVNVGDHKFVGLHAVYMGDSNFVALSAAGAYTVDWGDGSAIENIANGVQANHNFLFASLPEGTLTSQGYKQAVVTVIMQGGQTFTNLNLNLKHNQVSLNSYNAGWLDIKMAGAFVNTLTIPGFTPVFGRSLHQFEYVGVSAITSMANKFQDCRSLQNVIGTEWTAVATNFSTMFSSCYSLQTVPLFQIKSTGTIDFSNMFASCSSLQTIPLFNTIAGTNFSSMFNACYALKSVPLFNTIACANFSYMFSTCTSLETVPLFPIKSTGSIDFSSMFNACYSLKSVPLLNTIAGVTFSSMFNACYALKSVPLFNTIAGSTFNSMFNACFSLKSVPLFNTIAGITFNNMFTVCYSLESVPLFPFKSTGTINCTSMFQNCYALKSVPLFNTIAVTNFSSMFNGCYSLQNVPLFNTIAGTNFTSMFGNCTSLQTVPLFNTSSGTIFTSMFDTCPSLQVGVIFGTSRTISYTNCKLSAAELNSIYTNLAQMNLLSANAASMETSIADWNVNLVNCTVSWNMASPAPDGARVVRTGSSGIHSVAITNRLAVTPDTLFTFMATVGSNGGSNSAAVAIAWYDAAGVIINTVTGSTVTLPAYSGPLLNQAIIKATSPSNAVTASLILKGLGAAGTDWDKMGFFPGDVSYWNIGGPQTITVTGNWGNTTDNPSIATAKGWTVTG